MDYYRIQNYGHVENKLASTTIANRAAGMDEHISPEKGETPKKSSLRAKLTIPEQIA